MLRRTWPIRLQMGLVEVRIASKSVENVTVTEENVGSSVTVFDFVL